VHQLFSFFLVGSAVLLAAVSPGPDFVVVSKNSTIHSRQSGMWTALGVGVAVMVHATYSLEGLGLIVERSLSIFSIIRWMGALYLAYLGISLLLKKTRPVTVPFHLSSQGHGAHISRLRSFAEGFATNLLNPKAVVFFVGIFAQVVSRDSSLTKALYIAEASVIVTAWFFALAWMLNLPVFKVAFARMMAPLQKIMGLLLVAFAVKLAFDRS